MIETDQLLYERRDSAAFVTLNRPEAHNSMTWRMYDALYEACALAEEDDEVRVVVVRGAGEKAFVAGTDINQFREFSSGDDGVVYEQRIETVLTRFEELPKPTIAVISGYATGFGLALAAASDLRLCSSEAKFGMPIAKTLGNCLSMANYARLVSLVGAARTKELLYTARMVGAEEALASGLATEIVAGEELERRLEELCNELASRAPVTLRVSKEALRRIEKQSLPDGTDLIRECYASEDFHEGVAAFLEKRKPAWRGV